MPKMDPHDSYRLRACLSVFVPGCGLGTGPPTVPSVIAPAGRQSRLCGFLELRTAQTHILPVHCTLIDRYRAGSSGGWAQNKTLNMLVLPSE